MNDIEQLREELDHVRGDVAAQRRRSRRGRIITLAIGGAVVAASAAGVAYASVPSADNTITACVAKAGGLVRIVDTDAGQTCSSTETQVQWGGGMRYIGTWSNIGSRPKVNGYPDIHKGDVVYYDGAPNAFGCSTPRGSWVSVAGAYAYPCLEYPQNWAPLALDGAAGAPGKNADVHWANFDATGKLIGSSDASTYVYNSASYGYVYIQFPNLDLTKCSLATNVSSHGGSIAGYSSASGTPFADEYYGYILAGVRQTNGFKTPFQPITVTATCVHY